MTNQPMKCRILLFFSLPLSLFRFCKKKRKKMQTLNYMFRYPSI